MPKPTLGRTVHYTLTQDDANTINRRRAGRATRDRIDVETLGNRAEAGHTYPATVVRTWPGTPGACNLQVHLDGVDAHWATSRVEGTVPGTWTWPPRS
ncbi:hypothetical protein ACFWP2_20600 [Kitasatospora sp. NPDC058444]|uniref:hypothetical protein n=1 Tax=Kitasatospora sp. NPDC058444 TaxID=3346504 RepID=UPI00364BE5FB